MGTAVVMRQGLAVARDGSGKAVARVFLRLGRAGPRRLGLVSALLPERTLARERRGRRVVTRPVVVFGS